jgi:hypothetical protein
MNDRLDPRLAALLQLERGQPDPSDPTRARVQARVHATLAIPLPQSSSSPPAAPPVHALAPLARAAAISLALIGGTSGALLGIHAWSGRPAASRAMPPPVPTASATADVTLPTVAPPTLSDAPPHASAPPAASTSSPVPRPSSARDLAVERSLLDRARRDLLRGESAAALISIAEHALRFPRGVLSEERDALRVEALVAASRYDEARSSALKFHAAHPGSMLTQAVDDTLGMIP